MPSPDPTRTPRPAVWMAAVAALTATGCAPLTYLQETTAVDTTGAFQITDREVVEPLDLGWLLLRYAPGDVGGVCEARAKHVPGYARPSRKDPDDENDTAQLNADRSRLDRSAAYFHCIAMRDPQQAQASRNALQERMLLASQQRCNAFKTNLQRHFSRTNFALGAFTTVAGTAGALVSGNSVAAARNWAGAAAALSGMRAEFNQDYMNNLAAHVIIDGVDKRRETVHQHIQQLQAQPYARYSVEAAMKDAIYYHGQCSVVAGFQQAADAIKTVNDPGLNRALQITAQVRGANAILADTKLSPEEQQKRVAALATYAPAPPLAPPDDLGTPGFTRVRSAIGLVQAKVAAMRDQLEALDKDKTTSTPQAVLDAMRLALDALRGPGPFDGARLTPVCLDKSAALVSEQLKQQALAEQSTGADRLVLDGRADTARRQGDLIAQTLQALADQYTAAADRALVARQQNGAGALAGKASEQAAFIKSLAPISLSDPLVKQAAAMCSAS